jgi:hypothetical protein
VWQWIWSLPSSYPLLVVEDVVRVTVPKTCCLNPCSTLIKFSQSSLYVLWFAGSVSTSISLGRFSNDFLRYFLGPF